MTGTIFCTGKMGRIFRDLIVTGVWQYLWQAQAHTCGIILYSKLSVAHRAFWSIVGQKICC